MKQRIFCLFGLLFFNHSLWAAQFKVISLSPHSTEIAFEAGLGDNLIAVSTHSDYPPQAQKLEQVANYRGINIERIIALKPDLVIAWKGGNPEKELKKLTTFGIKIFESNPHSLYDTANDIEQLGKFSTNPQLAINKANELRAKLHQIESENKNKPKISYFYQLSQTPLMTNNAKHWPQILFSLCQGENVFGSSVVAYPQISIEQVITKKPQVIFSRYENFSLWHHWKDYIPAVKNNALFTIKEDWLSRPSSRSLVAVEQICAYFDEIRKKQN